MGQSSSQITPLQDRTQHGAALPDRSSSKSSLAIQRYQSYRAQSVDRTLREPSVFVSKLSAELKPIRFQKRIRSSSPQVIVYQTAVSASQTGSEIPGEISPEVPLPKDLLSIPGDTTSTQSAISPNLKESSTMAALDQVSRKRKRHELNGDQVHKSKKSNKESSTKRKKSTNLDTDTERLHTLSIRQGAFDETSREKTGKRKSKSKRKTERALTPPPSQGVGDKTTAPFDVTARSPRRDLLSDDRSSPEFLEGNLATPTPNADPSSTAEDKKSKKTKRKKEGSRRESDDHERESLQDRTRCSPALQLIDEDIAAQSSLPSIVQSANGFDAITSPDENNVTDESIKRDKNGMRIGPFSDKEKAIANKVFARACAVGKCTDFELRRRIAEDWRNLDIFKKDIFEAFSDRTVKSVYRFCRRRFHPFERGPWSTEEDQELKTAYSNFPDQWVKIAELVGRSSEAVRDRYRNYLMYDDNLETGLWTEEQEEALLKAVAEAMAIIKKAHPNVDDTELLESWIDWNLVSSKLNGARSRKRCSEKYQKLKRRHPSALPGAKAHQDDEPPSPFFRSCALPADFRTSLLRFDSGDIWDLLTEIHSAIEDHERSFYEETTFWSLVSSHNPLSRFSSRTRRRVFHLMVERYSGDFSVQSLTTYAAKARRMAELLVQDANGEPLPRRYRLNRLGWTPEQIRQWRARRKRKAKLTKDLERRDSYTPDLLRQ